MVEKKMEGENGNDYILYRENENRMETIISDLRFKV